MEENKNADIFFGADNSTALMIPQDFMKIKLLSVAEMEKQGKFEELKKKEMENKGE